MKRFGLTGIRFFIAIQVFTTTLVLFTGIFAVEIGSMNLNDSLKRQAFFTYTDKLKETLGIEKAKRVADDNPKLHVSQVNRAFWHMRWVILIGGLIAFFSGLALAYTIRKPIHHLIKGVDQVASGDFSRRVKLKAESHIDEFGPLIHAYNKMVDSLNQSEEKLRKVFFAVGDAMIATDADGKVNLWGGGSKELFGYSYEEILQKPIDILISSENPPHLLRSLQETALASGRWEGEAYYRTKDGKTFQGWCVATHLRDDQGMVMGYLHVIRDVTEKKQLELQLIQSEKLASVGELAAGVAHEINNPLSGILSNAEFLQEGIPEEEVERHEEIREIIANTDRIKTIVRDLLNFSRQRDAERFQAVSIESILVASLNLTEHQMELDNIRLIKEYGENLPLVYGSANKIEQVFINVLSNARYALNKRFPEPNEDKILRIKTSLCAVDGRNYIRTEFYDQGIGIPKELMERVTRPFFTTKEAGMGTGLGLSISANLVREHRGRMIFESEEGRFTRVTIDLPVWEGVEEDG